jgi:hypothetical protein
VEQPFFEEPQSQFLVRLKFLFSGVSEREEFFRNMLGKNEKAKVTRPEIFRNFLRLSMLVKKERSLYSPSP